MGNAKRRDKTKVFRDNGNAEWRCVEGELQMRQAGYTEDGLWPDKEDQSFGTAVGVNQEAWLDFLKRHYRSAFNHAMKALANPMTKAEAALDDEWVLAEVIAWTLEGRSSHTPTPFD